MNKIIQKFRERPKNSDNLKAFWRFFKVEYRFSVTPAKAMMVVAGIFFSLLIIIISIVANSEITKRTFEVLLSAGSLYIPMYRSNAAVLEKAKIDRAKVAYLIYDKRTISITKTIIELQLVFISYLTVIVIALLATVGKPHFLDSDDIARLILIFTIGNTFLYIPMYIGFQWFMAMPINQNLAAVFGFFWIIFLSVPPVVLGQLINFIPQIEEILLGHNTEFLFYLVPWLNMAAPTLIISGHLPIWSIVVPFLEIIIFCHLFWEDFSLKLKNFVAAN